ncbi:phosphoserine transaminase [Acidiferrimicrobium sp. IK]|uniref:phosphoserine transaminase n=1 Tax=Acidiferrimicrobium sp. IK TaxID=2871700 RepID=UPI0021CB4078|nr:phosphoserine transaminase [Acidiferrimicrobium sp. IK]MCU4186537.1 phosphoserine transaminase [Acidiferrimicrobium sp. IK]
MTGAVPTDIRIPPVLLPADGRFGSGPSKVRPDAVAVLASLGTTLLGTSHRQAPVRALVRRLRDGLSELFALPDGYQVVLGNGGSTLFWDVATFGLIERRSQHVSFGEFSSKFAAAASAAPHLERPDVIEVPAGTAGAPRAEAGVDLYALTHNETSTGVVTDLRRPEGADDGALVAVDATSAAGGVRFDPEQVDVYYFAPQKGFASDGGLWVAALSPAALERVARIAASGRWVPASLDLSIAVAQSALDQTYNTPALATLVLMVDQLEWMLAGGGLEWSAGRCDRSAEILYRWAESSAYAAPFVAKPDERSPVVGTIDLEGVDALTVSAVLRANGVVDTESYRKLGRNQVRVGMFPAVDPSDVEALTACIDHVVTALS